MLHKIVKTKEGFDLTILRIALGAVMFPHGAQKMLGWFGGGGWTGTMHFFTETVHMSYFTGALTILIEFFGSIMLITGTFTRVAALGILGLFIGIIFNIALPNGFFMNWGGDQHGEGFEYHLLVLGMSLALIIGGAGKLSVDSLISKKQTIVLNNK
jgi:putative oxidoreductase